jgi:predicted small secreted protein
MIKSRFAIFTLVMLALALTACGGGDGGGEDVTKPVNDFFKAFGEMDAEKAAQAVCEQHRDNVKAGLDMIFGFMAMGGEDAKIEIVDLKLEAQDHRPGRGPGGGYLGRFCREHRGHQSDQRGWQVGRL